MEIHVLDIALYFPIMYIIWLIMADDYKEEIGILVGYFIILFFTIIYCIIFYFYNWIDLVIDLNLVL